MIILRLRFVGLTDGRATIIDNSGGTGDFVTFQVGADPSVESEVKLAYLDLQGDDVDYVVVNNEQLTMTNVSITDIDGGTSSWNTAPINNIGTVIITSSTDNTGFVALDGGAVGNDFVYSRDSVSSVTLSYVGGDNDITTGSEYSDTLWNVELVDSAVVVVDDSRTIGNTLTTETGTSLTLAVVRLK